jgi:hypothetical protein
MINVYLKVESMPGECRGNFIQEFFSLSSSLPFCFAALHAIYWFCGFSLFLMTFMSFFLVFEIQTLCFLLSMYPSRGRLRNQVVSSLV